MITLGTFMFITGILGIVLCGVSLCILPKRFQKQREQLLDELKLNKADE